MKIDQARSIPLAQILESLGCKPSRIRNYKSTYLSPLRSERTPSFHVDHCKNLWYDFGIGEGGSVIGFARAWLKSHNEAYTTLDVLRWLENMSGTAPVVRPVVSIERPPEESNLVLKKVSPLTHRALVKYVTARGIPMSIASRYLVEVSLHNRETNKNFFAIGFRNEEGGYEFRNPFLKGCVGKKTITFIRGKQVKPDAIHIFEGLMDYASALTSQNVTQFDGDTIVLNSLSCLRQATPYINNYGYHFAYTWLDNDKAGAQGTKSLSEFFKIEAQLQHSPMNDLYQPHKDVNAWHMNRLSLSL